MDRSIYTQTGDLVWHNGLLYQVGPLKMNDVVLPLSTERPMEGQKEPVTDVLRLPADRAFFVPYINNQAPYRPKEKRTWDQLLLLAAITLDHPLAYSQDLAREGVAAVAHLQKQNFFSIDLANLTEEDPWAGTDFDLLCDVPTTDQVTKRFYWAKGEELKWLSILASRISYAYQLGGSLQEEFEGMSRTISLSPA